MVYIAAHIASFYHLFLLSRICGFKSFKWFVSFKRVNAAECRPDVLVLASYAMCL